MGAEFKTLSPGTVVSGRYEIEKCLGVGSAAMVYKCRDLRLPRITALKVLFPHVAKANKGSARFKKEIMYSYEINDRNVVRTYEFVEDEELDVTAITMEFVNGGDLVGLLEGPDPLSIAGILDVSAQLLSGVKAIHDCGIIHRDLKPENLLITTDGVIKIADFSVAWTETATRLTGHGGVVGSIAYISPEYLERGELDKRADLYGVAVILYEILTGQAPFEADNVIGILAARNKEATPDPAKHRLDCPKELSKIVKKGLEKNPDDRYSSAEEMLAEIERLRGTMSYVSDPQELKNAVQNAWGGETRGRTSSMFYRAQLVGRMHLSKTHILIVVLLMGLAGATAVPSLQEFADLFLDKGRGTVQLSAKQMRLASQRKIDRELSEKKQELQKEVEIARKKAEEEALRLTEEAKEAQKAAEDAAKAAEEERAEELKKAEEKAAEMGAQLAQLQELEKQRKESPTGAAQDVVSSIDRQEKPVQVAKAVVKRPPKEPTYEYKVKAALIMKFIEHFTWPDQKKSQFGSELPFCIVGSDPFGRYLTRVAKKSKPKGKSHVSVKQLSSRALSSSISKCQVAFISGWEQSNTNELVRKFHKKGVLTVTEKLSAGIIHLYVVRGNVKFDINEKEAKVADLGVSPALIKLAKRS